MDLVRQHEVGPLREDREEADDERDDEEAKFHGSNRFFGSGGPREWRRLRLRGKGRGQRRVLLELQRAR